ncbi:UNVERIFIED_CONTAM: hypothetical protein K2H54_025248 [Gekko kuhli]
MLSYRSTKVGSMKGGSMDWGSNSVSPDRPLGSHMGGSMGSSTGSSKAWGNKAWGKMGRHRMDHSSKTSWKGGAKLVEAAHHHLDSLGQRDTIAFHRVA